MGISHGPGHNPSLEETEPVLLKVLYQAGANEMLLGDFIGKHQVRDKILSGFLWVSSIAVEFRSQRRLDGLQTRRSETPFLLSMEPGRRINQIAKIDAVQAEYSAFETVHWTDGLIGTVKELGVVYVAYGPLGQGWLVDDFPYRTPDEFTPDDFRRTVPKFQGENF
ncbi:hypothetical protein LTR36_010315 [Oleoguttula mirabilis]|uniref:Uncharacterized protein n=1 Tax=Oleoguttula mirabilis TaxID=1507867 RepID=A0AAV9J4Y0_9PEZI|nr:hypothetical protein LTR36_010315 [Oleoguttula mirabilis]